MRANKAILCGVVLAAVSLAMAEPAADKAADKEHIALINEYFAAVNKQDIKGALKVTIGQATDPAIKACAYAKAFAKTVDLPVKASARKRKKDGVLAVYDVSITTKSGGKTTQSITVMALKLVDGHRKIVAIATPKQWAAGLDPAVFNETPRPDPKFVTWAYQFYIAEATYVKEMAARAAGPRRERGDNCLRRPYYSKIRDLDPATCGDTASTDIQAHVFEGLYGYHYLKRPVEVIPLLADGMPKISKDGLIWTIKIKKRVKYSRNPCFGRDEKGKPKTRTVTADDFVLAFKRIADYHVKTRLAMAFVGDKIAGFGEYRRKTKTYASADFSRYDVTGRVKLYHCGAG